MGPGKAGRGHGRRTGLWLALGCALLAAPLASPAGAAALGKPGDLDPTFHGGKPVLADLAKTVPHLTDFYNLLVDGAGRIVVAGQSTDADGHAAVAVARFSADGATDAGFGEGGSRVIQLGAGTFTYSTAQSLFPVPGRYVGFGVSRNANERFDQSAYVIGDNGAGDSGFGSAGLATINWPPSPSEGSTSAAAAAPSGTVYVSGTTNEGGTHATEVTKFTPAGKWGESFPGVVGTYVHRFGEAAGAESTGGPIATLPDDSMLIAGSASLIGGGNGLLLVHLSPGGTLDGSFGLKGGYSVIDASDPGSPVSFSFADDILVGPQREIYVVGNTFDAAEEQELMVARFTPSGNLDFTFGSGGIKRIQLAGPGQRSWASALALQPDGRIVVLAQVEGLPRSRILRLRQDGSLDPSFGNGGVVTPDLGGEQTSLSAAAIVGDRLLVSGSVKNVGQYSGAVAAYLLESLPDPQPGKGALRLRKKSLVVDAKGRVRIPLSCSAAGPCRGRISLLSKAGKATISKTKKATTYAKAGYKLAAGAKKAVTLKLGKPLRARARAKAGLAARLAVAPQGAKAQIFAVKLHR